MKRSRWPERSMHEGVGWHKLCLGSRRANGSEGAPPHDGSSTEFSPCSPDHFGSGWQDPHTPHQRAGGADHQLSGSDPALWCPLRPDVLPTSPPVVELLRPTRLVDLMGVLLGVGAQHAHGVIVQAEALRRDALFTGRHHSWRVAWSVLPHRSVQSGSIRKLLVLLRLCLLACPPACLPASLPACLLACLLASWLACWLSV